MLDFRKVLLASVAGLGLVGAASAQVLTTATNPQPVGAAGYVPIESTTGQLPTVVIAFAGTSPGSVTVVVNSNVPFTNVVPTLTPATTNLDISVTQNTLSTCLPANVTGSAPSSITASGPTQITMVFSTVSNTATAFCIAGLRVNSSLAPANSAITLTATGIPGGGFSSTATTPGTEAYAYKSLATPAATQFANINSCTNSATTALPVVSWTIASGFPGSLETQAQQLGTSTVPTASVLPTVLAVTLTNLNPGVSYYLPTAITGTNVNVQAYTDATTATAVTAASIASITTLNGLTAPVFLVTSSTGTATVYYGVTGNAAGNESFVIPVFENIPTITAVTSFNSAPVGLSVTFGSGVVYPQYPSTQTPSAGAQTSSAPYDVNTEGILQACSTTLLFPYVVNASGFDTGFVITNATTGITGTSKASGTCSVSFYGTGAPTTAYVTAVIPTATNVTFSASGQAPGVNGYAVAVCNFKGAHGYAFLFSGAGTPAAYASDYLAVVLLSAGAAPATVAF